jgi:multicomponent K+:H+ antiporter subunit G
MTLIEEIVVTVMLVTSGLFGLIGSFGILKLDHAMRRLHAPTKATTVGVGTALVASSVYFWLSDRLLSWHELLIMVFLFVTAPITAQFLAKTYIHRTALPGDLPETGTGRPWATLEPDRDPGA